MSDILDMADEGDKDGLVKRLKEIGTTDECAVVNCERDDTDMVELYTFDPIDHDDKYVTLCSVHQQWAARRNDLAMRVRSQLREARKEIGQDHYDEIQSLAVPQGVLDSDILDGKDQGVVELDEVIE